MTQSEAVTRMVKSRNSKTGVRINNSRIRRRPLNMSKRQLLLIVSMLFLFMGSGIGLVWSNFECTQMGYDLSELKKEEMRLREVNQKLRLELALLKSPQNLEQLAVSRIGLRPPLPDQIVVLP